ncbi:MAG TPA: hypothetical protein VK936_04930 [Longimicrobiales bacterium]|nr:hypothetical protein [Longimicrobiales bacterium]
MYLGILFGVLALAAGLVFRSRLDRVIGRRSGALTDDMVREIVESGRIEVEEPLDLDEIQAEEARFWEEPWDDPDEW